MNVVLFIVESIRTWLKSLIGGDGVQPVTPKSGVRRALTKSFFRLVDALLKGDTRGVELLHVAIMMVWGIWLLLPMSLFDAAPFSSRPMQRFASENVWGVIFVLTALTRLLSLGFNWIWLRIYSALLTTCIWVFMAALFFPSDWRLFGGALMMVYAVSAAWVFLRLKGDRQKNVIQSS